jgi:uncharacterized iron-regulated membrane protein
LGERLWGDITQGLKNVMPFIYRLHYSLALGIVGNYIFGAVALLWTLDCFVGAYLTFPARRRTAATQIKVSKSWLKRWWPAWKLRTHSGSYKLNVDLHRAGGLWPWAMLLVLAWSSVGFNLQEVYKPVMAIFFNYQPGSEEFPTLKEPLTQPQLGWHKARTRGQSLMQKNAEQHQLTILHEDSLSYDMTTGSYRYSVKSNRDIGDTGRTSVYFDANTGVQRAVYFPTRTANGDTINIWLFSLHMAAVWGLPMQIFVCMMGLIVAALSITGVIIWLKKYRARRYKM